MHRPYSSVETIPAACSRTAVKVDAANRSNVVDLRHNDTVLLS